MVLPVTGTACENLAVRGWIRAPRHPSHSIAAAPTEPFRAVDLVRSHAPAVRSPDSERTVVGYTGGDADRVPDPRDAERVSSAQRHDPVGASRGLFSRVEKHSTP